MAESEHYIITIRDERAKEKKQTTAKTMAGDTNDERGDQTSIPPSIAKIASFGYAVSVVDSYVSMALNTVDLRTGNSTFQQKVNFYHQSTRKALDIAANVVTAGSLFGAAGAVVAGLGLSVTGIVDMANNVNTYSMEKQLESYALEMTNIRAGTLGNRGGTR